METFKIEPTMSELLELSQDIKPPRKGATVKGIVVSINPGEILIDIGFKSEGIVTSRNMDRVDPTYLESIKVGDEIPVYILHTEDADGYVVLSLNKAVLEQDWELAQQAFEAGEIFDAEIVASNKGGVIAYYRSVRGFVPGSQLVSGRSSNDANDPWRSMVGHTLSQQIIEVDRRRNRLILSERAAVEKIRQAQKEVLLDKLTEGETRTGKVVGLADFGAFVDLGGAEGLIHLSELAWVQINHPNEVVAMGDELDVYILDVDRDRQRIGLSLKRLQPEPWSQAPDIFEVGQLVKGTITKLTNFGAFARIDNMLDGLIHISELTSRHITHPREVVNENDEVELRIISIDPDRRRLGLSLKQVTEPVAEWYEYEGEEPVEDADDDAVAPLVESDTVLEADPETTADPVA
jgi:small subunit ribosomal protein S1